MLTTLSAAGWIFPQLRILPPFSQTNYKLLTTVDIHQQFNILKQLEELEMTKKTGTLALSFLMDEQYYSKYIGTFSLMGLPVVSDTAWER